jgi:hypothetical protein
MTDRRGAQLGSRPGCHVCNPRSWPVRAVWSGSMDDRFHSAALRPWWPLTAAERRPIRLGLILNGYELPAWQAWVLRELRQLKVEIPIVLQHSGADGSRSRGPLYRSWRILDCALTSRSANRRDPLVASGVRQLLGEAQWIEAERCGQALGRQCLEKLAGCRPDIVLQLGCQCIHEEACREEQLRLWFCRLAGRLEAAGDLGLVSSMAKQAPVESTVEELTASGCQVLRRSFTALTRYSLYRSEVRAYWKLAGLLLDEIQGMRAGSSSVTARPSPASLPLTAPPFAEPRRSAALILGIGRRQAARALSRGLGRDTWTIGIRRRRCWMAADYHTPDLTGFVTLPSPATAFRADPFLVEYAGRHFIFFEEFRYSTRRGIIGCMEIFGDLRVGEPQAVLERPYHLSYPFVIREHDQLFMIPESARNGVVELYRCVNFPDRWILDGVLLEGFAGIDSTVVRKDGRFWLFSCRRDDQSDTSDDLYIFWATSLRGPWQPHALNPVLSDVRRARSAGSFIEAGGELFRPSQDGSKRYGWRIKINRVVRLSETEYEEEPIGVVDSRWSPGVEGAHTWNADSTFEVIDGPTWRPRWTTMRAGRAR